MISLRFSTAVLAALGSLSLAAGCSTDNSDASFRVNNQSDFAITELEIAPSGSTSWGANLLASNLLPGDTVTIDVTCNTYDAMLVDESGVSCEVDNIDLCLNDADWVIQNNTCAVFGNAAPAHATAKSAGSGSAAH